MGKPVTAPAIARAPGLAATLTLGAALLLFAPAAQAQTAADAAKCTVRIIVAKHKPEQPALPDNLLPLKAQLTSGPLSVWKNFELKAQHDLIVVAKGKAATFEVPGNHGGSLELVERVTDANAKDARLRLQLQITDGPAKLLNARFLLNNGGTMMQGGIKLNDGVVLMGITCKLSS